MVKIINHYYCIIDDLINWHHHDNRGESYQLDLVQNLPHPGCGWHLDLWVVLLVALPSQDDARGVPQAISSLLVPRRQEVVSNKVLSRCILLFEHSVGGFIWLPPSLVRHMLHLCPPVRKQDGPASPRHTSMDQKGHPSFHWAPSGIGLQWCESQSWLWRECRNQVFVLGIPWAGLVRARACQREQKWRKDQQALYDNCESCVALRYLAYAMFGPRLMLRVRCGRKDLRTLELHLAWHICWQSFR